MDLQKLIESCPDLNLTVRAKELKAFGEGIASQAAQLALRNQVPKLQPRKEYMEEKQICAATFWRWKRSGVIKTKTIGNKVYVLREE